MGVTQAEVDRLSAEERRAEEMREVRKASRTRKPDDAEKREKLHLEAFKADLDEIMHKHISERGLQPEKAIAALLDGVTEAERYERERTERAESKTAMLDRWAARPTAQAVPPKDWAADMKQRVAEVDPMKHYRQRDNERDFDRDR